MRIRILLEKIDSHPEKIIAYHCGSKTPESDWNMSEFGKGEGMSQLGPGIYFATNREIAELYCKYGGRRPFMHKVEIPNNMIQGLRSKYLPGLKSLVDELESDPANLDKYGNLKRDVKKKVVGFGVGYSGLGAGGPAIGGIVTKFGYKEGIKKLIEAGVIGAYEKLPLDRGYEITIWDMSKIKTLETYYSGSHPYEIDEEEVRAKAEGAVEQGMRSFLRDLDFLQINWDEPLFPKKWLKGLDHPDDHIQDMKKGESAEEWAARSNQEMAHYRRYAMVTIIKHFGLTEILEEYMFSAKVKGWGPAEKEKYNKIVRKKAIEEIGKIVNV